MPRSEERWVKSHTAEDDRRCPPQKPRLKSLYEIRLCNQPDIVSQVTLCRDAVRRTGEDWGQKMESWSFLKSGGAARD